jgi:hypothetical protein
VTVPADRVLLEAVAALAAALRSAGFLESRIGWKSSRLWFDVR